MGHSFELLNSLLVMTGLIVLAIFLRRRATIRDEEQAVFGRLVTDFSLPALIFSSLSRSSVSADELHLALLLFTAIVFVMVIAWLLGRLAGLRGPVLGSVILVAGVGSSSTLGYSIIGRMFGGDPEIMAELVVIGEFGVIIPLLSVGVLIAMHFGDGTRHEASVLSVWRTFLTSPIFAAIVLGLLVSNVGLPFDKWPVTLLDDLLQVAGGTLPVLVAFSIGLMLRPIALSSMFRLVLLVAALKLVVEPLFVAGLTHGQDIGAIERELLIIEAAMPSGALAAVLAARYGCDGAVASAMVIATFALSLLSAPVIIWLTL